MTIVLCGLVAFIILATAFNVFRSSDDPNSTFLEWDPVARSHWRAEVDEHDVHHMLEQLNLRRVERGEPELTMAEYVEQLRRE